MSAPAAGPRPRRTSADWYQRTRGATPESASAPAPAAPNVPLPVAAAGAVAHPARPAQDHYDDERDHRTWKVPAVLAVTVAAAMLALILTSTAGQGPAQRSPVVPGSALGAADSETESYERAALGPLVVALPASLGPWPPAPAGAAGATWSIASPAGAVVRVKVYAPGTHGGLPAIPAGEGTSAQPPKAESWPGAEPHEVTTRALPDGTTNTTLLIARADGSLVEATATAPTSVFDSAGLSTAILTATLSP